MLLAPNEAHTWSVNVNDHLEQVELYRQLLSEAELAKANRFVFLIHQERYIIAHAVLRLILEKYLSIPAARIAISAEKHHKPHVHGQTIEFNLSHSEQLVVYAVSHTPVGIDTEFIKSQYHIEIAQRYFHPAETAAILNRPGTEQAACFYDIWSRKEAVLKASGDTFAINPNEFDSLQNEILVRDRKWRVIPLALNPEFATTLVTTPDIEHIIHKTDILNPT